MVVLHALGTVTHTVQAGELEWSQTHPAAKWLLKQPVDWLATDDSYALPALKSFAGADWQTKPMICVGKETERKAIELGWHVFSLEQLEQTSLEREKTVSC